MIKWIKIWFFRKTHKWRMERVNAALSRDLKEWLSYRLTIDPNTTDENDVYVLNRRLDIEKPEPVLFIPGRPTAQQVQKRLDDFKRRIEATPYHDATRH